MGDIVQVDEGTSILSGWRLKHRVHTSGLTLGNTGKYESGWRLKHIVHKVGGGSEIPENMRVGGDLNI